MDFFLSLFNQGLRTGSKYSYGTNKITGTYCWIDAGLLGPKYMDSLESVWAYWFRDCESCVDFLQYLGDSRWLGRTVRNGSESCQ